MSAVDPFVCFQGEVEVLNATWSLNDGRRVEFRICGEAYHRQHPFKRFQQKRNGHVGTRFKASFARLETGECLSVMELMLCGWKDSSSVGQSVTFWLDDEPDTHPFCGCTPRKAQMPGDMFALVLVELDDDERPVDQVRQRAIREQGGAEAPADLHDQGAADPGAGAPAPAAAGNRPGPGSDRPPARRKLSSAAHLLVTRPMFVQFLKETKPNLVKSWTPEVARKYAKGLIGVESLSDLDRDRGAAQRFETLIKQPYERWAHQDPR